jgi:quinol monooxygenase YgiN
MIVLIARYHTVPGKRQEVESILREMAPLVREHESGCRDYQASRSLDDPDLLLLYEVYDDMEAVELHRTTPHFKELIEGRAVPLLQKRERELYESVVP